MKSIEEQIGKRINIVVTYKNTYSYVDYNFDYYGTAHYIHTFKDEDGDILVWKTTSSIVDFNLGSVVEMKCTIKGKEEYKGVEQIAVSRCKFSVITNAKTKEEKIKEKQEEQEASLKDGDFIWCMPYRQYKQHYSDCETIVETYRDGYIDVIIRNGRLKPSGTRGQRYKSYQFTSKEGKQATYYAISEETARKRLMKEHNGKGEWECTGIIDFKWGGWKAW